MNGVEPQKYRLALEPLSPVHVGGDWTIEPYEYVPHVQQDACFLVVIDVQRLFARLGDAERRRYDEVVRKGDFPGLRAWLHETAHPIRDRLFAVQVQDAAFEKIRDNLDNPDSLGEIELSTREPATGRPYIPGSSVKGALRTAIADAVAQESTGEARGALDTVAERAAKDRHPGPKFEATAFGNLGGNNAPDLYRDPLRQLAISDLPMAEDSCYIDEVKIVREDGSIAADPEGIAMYRDMTWSRIDGDSAEGAGQVRLFPHLAARERMGRDKEGNPNWLPFGLDVETICRRANEFYRPRLEDELERFKRSRNAAELEKWASILGERECLIRLGHHSHIECVTVGPPWRRKPAGRTRSYAAGEFPLGWAKLRFEPEG